MKNAIIAFIVLVAGRASAQNLVINNAFVKLVGSSNIIQFDSASGAIKANGGGIQTHKGTGVVWRIKGSGTDQYTVPFSNQTGTPIPVKYQNASVGSPAKLRFQTWSADSTELVGVGSTVYLNRLWKIDGMQRPATIEIKYADADIPQSLLGESLLSITRLWKGQWTLAENTVVNPAQNSISYFANDSASYSTNWAVIEIDIPLSTNIRWIDYECSSSKLVWESDLLDYTYIIYGSNDGRTFVAIDSSHTESRINSALIGPKYKYLKIEQKFDDRSRYESRLIKTCSIRVPVSLDVYPNPTTGKLWIHNASDPEVEVRDLNGKALLTAYADQIDIGNLVNGIYFITVQDGDMSKNFKIVKI